MDDAARALVLLMGQAATSGTAERRAGKRHIHPGFAELVGRLAGYRGEVRWGSPRGPTGCRGSAWT